MLANIYPANFLDRFMLISCSFNTVPERNDLPSSISCLFFIHSSVNTCCINKTQVVQTRQTCTTMCALATAD